MGVYQEETKENSVDLLFQAGNLYAEGNAADDTERLRMHADAVQQRRDELRVVKA